MIVLGGTKAPKGGVLTLADNTAPIVVPNDSRLISKEVQAQIGGYVAATTAYYDANELCRKAAKP